jgi:hypothetical protein
MSRAGTKTLALLLSALAGPALCATLAAAAGAADPPAKSGTKVYELRTYHTHPGRLDALNRRFRDHTCRIFRKHGMELVGFWTPQDDNQGKADTLIYILAFPSRDAAKAAWQAFRDDPEWKTARADSEKDGPIVKEVQSVFLDPTDYSPAK